MNTTVVTGDQVVKQLIPRITQRMEGLNFTPKLATLMVGDDPGIRSYFRSIKKVAQKYGIEVIELTWDVTDTETVKHAIEQLNNDNDIGGILIGEPLPKGIDRTVLVETISPTKDVDCMHPYNLGLLMEGRPRVLPSTVGSVWEILQFIGVPLTGKRAVIIGRSLVVGKPLAMLLLQKGIDATVTVCHSKTEQLTDITREADILIVAVGKPHLIGKEHVKRGTIVIDVGINVVAGKLVGDVKFDEVRPLASYITPVPGGVGKVTTHYLMYNLVKSYEHRR